ncbi:hypothetical protein [Bacillus cereus]|nr:hypothetical protein [Bacillus cereus]
MTNIVLERNSNNITEKDVEILKIIARPIRLRIVQELCGVPPTK